MIDQRARRARSRGARAMRALLLAILCGVISAGCGGGVAGYHDVRHLLQEGSPPFLDLAVIGEPAELFSWSFTGADALVPWEVAFADRQLRSDGDALVIESSGNDPQMRRDVAFQSEELRELEIRMVGDPGRFKVYWAAPGAPFGEERSMTGDAEAPIGGDGFRTVRIPLARHEAWRGPIGSLRIDPTDVPGAAVRIATIRGLGLVLVGQRVRELADRPWQVGLGGDYRPSLVADVGSSLRRTLPGPRPGGHLEFGYGVRCFGRPEAPEPLQLEIVATTPGGQPRELFRREVAPLTPGPTDAYALPYGGWQEARVELPASAEGSLALEFRARASAAGGTSQCVAAWAEPIVLEPAAARRLPNVMLISIDTLRADRVELDDGGITPEIAAWARRRAVAFPHTIAAAPWTLPSHASMLTGLDALTHGVNLNLPVPDELTLLAERLRDVGYATAAFTGGGYVHHVFGFSQGFGRFVPAPLPVAAEDELVRGMDGLLEWLERAADRPFFAFFHTYEVHQPYHARQPYFDRSYAGELAARAADITVVRRQGPSVGRPELPDEGRLGWRDDPAAPTTDAMIELANALYDSGVSYADAQLGRLFRKLESLGLEDDTIVVLTSDHGEVLGEQGRAGHQYLMPSNLVVPLIIAAPEMRAGAVETTRVRSVDIVPTVLDLLELESGKLDGSSLVPLLKGDSGATETVWSYSIRWGLSLQFPDGSDYLFDPSAWSPRRGYQRLLPPDAERGTRDAPEPPAAAGESMTDDTDPTLGDLRRLALERIENLPAVALRFANRSDRLVRGYLRSPQRPLDPYQVKAPDLPCDCLVWRAEGAVEFVVPAATSYVVRLLELPDLPLELTGTVGEASFRVSVQPYDVDGEQSAALPGDTHLVAGPLAGEVGMTLWRTGIPWDRRGAAPPTDPLLLDRLRALGYLR